MVMKKYMQSKAMVIVGDSDASKKFPPGFSYVMGQVIYTVKDNVSKEANSQMRRVTTSEGDVEIMTIETIARDIRDPGSQILAEGKWEEEKEENKEDPKDGK